MQPDKVRKGLTDVRPSLKLEVKASQLEHGGEVSIQAQKIKSKGTKY